MKDYYKILGINRDAKEQEIKKAYRSLVLVCHPDRNPGDGEAEEKFKEITEAYEVLSNREKRVEYNLYNALRHGEGRNQFVFTSRFPGAKSDLSRGYFRGGKRGGRGRRCRMARSFLDEDSLPGWNRHSQQNELLYDLPLTASEALAGAEKEIFIKVPRGIQRFRIGLPPGLKDGTVLDIEGFNVGKVNLRLRVTIID
ncbi:MAG: DnaJ domain-containing protein [Deltaproteobacteria bacterium]|nr:DnaJ domain-containing protein [Deltaproteobacteria bacterium]